MCSVVLTVGNLVVFQRAVFQGLSQEALSACIQSLLKASEVILKNKVGTALVHTPAGSVHRTALYLIDCHCVSFRNIQLDSF